MLPLLDGASFAALFLHSVQYNWLFCPLGYEILVIGGLLLPHDVVHIASFTVSDRQTHKMLGKGVQSRLEAHVRSD